MLLKIALLFSLCFTLISCAIKNNGNSLNNNRNDTPGLGYYSDKKIESSPIPEMKKIKEYRELSIFQPLHAIKNGDTTNISELICLDSVLFTQAFSEIKVNEMCSELGIQGKTYYSTYTNKYGGFEDVRVVRSVDGCFKDTEEKMVLKVSEMRIIQEAYFESKIVFIHKYRLE